MTTDTLSSIFGLPFICATSGLFLFCAYNYYRRIDEIILEKKNTVYAMLLLHLGLISFSVLASAAIIHVAFHYNAEAFPGVCIGLLCSAFGASDSSRTFPKAKN